MAHVIEGKLSGKGKKVSIIASRFNDFITARLIEGAIDALVRPVSYTHLRAHET